MPAPTVTVLDGFAAFLSIEAEWRALYAAAVRPRPSNRHTWLRLSWTLQRQKFPNRLRVILVREAGELMMAGAFVLGMRGVTPTVTFLTSSMPQYEDVLWRASPRSELHATLLLQTLGRNLVPHRLRFEQMPADSPFYAALAATSMKRRRRREAPVAYLNMADYDGYQGYLGGLSHKLRADHNRRLRRLAEQPGFSLGLEPPEQHAETLRWLFDRKRAWVDETNRTATWLSNGLASRFYAALLASDDAPGVWIASLRLGTIAAAGVALVERDAVVFTNFTFDPAFGKQSPGRTLALSLIEMCFQQGFREFDMGLMTPWKHRLQPSFREQVSERAWL